MEQIFILAYCVLSVFMGWKFVSNVLLPRMSSIKTFEKVTDYLSQRKSFPMILKGALGFVVGYVVAGFYLLFLLFRLFVSFVRHV